MVQFILQRQKNLLEAKKFTMTKKLFFLKWIKKVLWTLIMIINLYFSGIDDQT